MPKGMCVQDAAQGWEIEQLECGRSRGYKHKNACLVDMPWVVCLGCVGESLAKRDRERIQQPQDVVRNAEDEVEGHVVRIVESREYA